MVVLGNLLVQTTCSPSLWRFCISVHYVCFFSSWILTHSLHDFLSGSWWCKWGWGNDLSMDNPYSADHGWILHGLSVDSPWWFDGSSMDVRRIFKGIQINSASASVYVILQINTLFLHLPSVFGNFLRKLKGEGESTFFATHHCWQIKVLAELKRYVKDD